MVLFLCARAILASFRIFREFPEPFQGRSNVYFFRGKFPDFLSRFCSDGATAVVVVLTLWFDGLTFRRSCFVFRRRAAGDASAREGQVSICLPKRLGPPLRGFTYSGAFPRSCQESSSNMFPGF